MSPTPVRFDQMRLKQVVSARGALFLLPIICFFLR
jgi:hypothetical protein